MVQQLFAMYGPQGGASAQGQGGGNPMSLIFMIVAIFAVMYFLMIRPQQRQKKQQQDLAIRTSGLIDPKVQNPKFIGSSPGAGQT